MGAAALAESRHPGHRRYRAPAQVVRSTLGEVLATTNRPPLDERQLSFVGEGQSNSDSYLFCAGDLGLLRRPAVAVVGARDVSEDGAKRARRLAKEIASAGVAVVSGLAKGVDVNAHRAAIQAGGATIAVIGTPLDKAYPAAHAELQETIYLHHLLISPFRNGTPVYPSSFPKRNRVMAALSDGTVIIEASDSSGTLHQAAECQRLGRWLFIVQSVFENPALKWPKSFAKYNKMVIVSSSDDIIGRIVP